MRKDNDCLTKNLIQSVKLLGKMIFIISNLYLITYRHYLTTRILLSVAE